MQFDSSYNDIVFVDLKGQLGTIRHDGANLQQITAPDISFQFPAWSPNGQWIAATGRTATGVGVYTVAAQPSGDDPLTLYESSEQIPFYLYWRPDNQAVTFIANHPTEGLGFYTASLSAYSSRLLRTGQPCFWDWTPQGDQILLHTGANSENAELMFIDPDGDPFSQKNIAQPGLFQAPGISSDGEFWAFASSDWMGNQQIVVHNSVGEVARAAYDGATAFNWNPAGRQIAFIAPNSPIQRYYGSLRVLNVEDGQIELVSDGTILAFFWSPDGEHLLYFTVSDDSPETSELITPPQQYSRNGTTGTNGVYRNGNGSHATASLHESLGLYEIPTRHRQVPGTLYLDAWLVNVKSKRRRRLLTFEPFNLFINQFLPFFDQYALSHRIWSPDSQAIVLPVVDEETIQVMVLPIDGRPAQAITEGALAFWRWQ